MSNITITNNAIGNVTLQDAQFRDGAITFTGAGTLAEGTILAVDSSTLKFVPFVKGGTTNENGIPKAVLTYDVTAAGEGDVQSRVAVAGSYRKELLIIAADGNASNVDQAVIDQLRDYGLVSIDVKELNILDNQ
jgi:hypothetical protein